jgi:hypothetical protein
MKCPSCGYQRQLRDNAYVPRNECPSCGITYAKSLHQSDDEHSQSDSSPHGPGYQSPVDETSLQQARERVASKLRKQVESRQKDEQHQQTLSRAKKITAAAVRKRQEEWERKQNQKGKPVEAHMDDPNIRADEPPANVPHDGTDHNEPILLNDPVILEASGDDAVMMELKAHDTIEARGVHDAQPESQKKEAPTSEDVDAGIEDKMPSKQTGKQKDSSETTHEEAITDTLGDENEHDIPETVIEPAPEPAPPENDPRDTIPIDPPPDRQSIEEESRENRPQRGWLMVAWLILITGGVGAVLSWSTIGHTLGSSESGATAMVLLLGFAYLAIGVLGFALFWVSSMINRQLKDIHQLLMDSKKE